MKGTRKTIAVLLVALFALTIAFPGYAEANPEIDISEHVTVEWYILGSPPVDWDPVMEEFNKLTNEELNCDVNVTWINFGDFLTKYPLLLASGENIDMCFAASWMNYASEAAKGAFYPITELAPIYAPTAYSRLTDEGVKCLSINGELYGLTGDDINREMMGWIVRGDLMKQYGMEKISTYQDLQDFCQAVVDNNPEMIPTTQGGDGGIFIYYAQNHGLFSVAMYNFPLAVNMDPEHDGEVVNMYEIPGALEYFEMMRDWCDRGFWSKSVLSDVSAVNPILTGEAALHPHNQNTWVDMYIAVPEYDLQYFPGQPHAYMDSYMQSVAAVGAGSQNPERSLMIYEKLVTDARYNDLLNYGIEGRNYEITENGQVRPLDLTVWTPGEICFTWMSKTKEFRRDIVGSPPNKAEVWEEIESMAAPNRYKMFAFDSEPVKNEFAAITNVIDEYAKPLIVGLVADPEAGLKTLNEQLYAAGLEKVREEMQRQIDEFNAAYDS